MQLRKLILGSAAGLLAISGAQAADLPVKAKAVEYVRICSLYGAGFFYIPGTDTCVKLGGYLRVDTTFNGGVHGQPAWNGDLGQQNRYRDYFVSRSRMALTIDTRTATEYGVVRTFGQGDFQFNNLGGGTANPAVLGAAGVNANLLSTPGGGYVAVEYLFIQFAGFTFGKSSSAYSTPWNGFPGNISSNLMGGNNTDTGVNNIQYTAQFGNGVSGTIGLDDPTVWNRTTVYNLALGVGVGGTGTNAYGGTHAPDIVGNIRVDQAWGLFQISGAAHLVNASYNTLGAGGVPTAASELSGHPEDKWGGSVMAALQIKNIPTGPGDDIKFDVSYAKGDTKNVIATSGSSPSFAMFGGSGFGYQSVGFGATTDGVYLPGVGGTGGIALTSAWGLRGAFNHNWNPYWSTSLYGSYSAVKYDGGANDNLLGAGSTTAKGAYCAAFAASHPGQALVGNAAGAYTCNPDFNVTQLGVLTRWTPVKNLTFSGEVQWLHLDQKMSGSSVFTATAPKPTALYEFKDQNTVFLQVRAQRNF
ncbi:MULTISPECIES: porin [Bradyrhizobium]|uniref:Porin n=2 Tax=Bradyrhizobium TaxID=374 RepID=A0ABY0PNN4_9BRAD|nr:MULTISPECIES: porin [Bradyrhizobium]SDI60372.1 Porin subfamily protein [Bradyrhizobium ottawaense]SED37206.1 Porin subfamily protein [Bradyrhizobium lablabi]SHL38998.1 Porin subfamily protein [Bradyrhizobium lablabi]